MLKTSSNPRYLPLRYLVLYVIFTFVIFLISPIKYMNVDFIILVSFLLAFLFIFALGYSLGTTQEDNDNSAHNYYEPLILRTLRMFIFITLGIVVWSLIEQQSVYNKIPDLEVLLNLAATYREAIYPTISVGILPSAQIANLFSPITKAAWILGMYYFSKLGWISRVMLIAALMIYFLNVLTFRGTQKPIGDIAIYFLTVMLIKGGKYRRNVSWKAVLFIICIVVPILAYIQSSRLASANGFNIYSDSTLTEIDYSNWIYTTFGRNMGDTITSFALYISVGYYGLSLTLQLPFVWTYGIGNSLALMAYADQYGIIEYNKIISMTYPMRMQMETGWPALRYWHSIFPWLASDLTFPGALLFMGFIAYLYATVWRESRIFENPISILIFANINIMLVFLQANNQLMQTRESTIAWLTFLVLWFLLHRKMNKKALVEKSQDVVKATPLSRIALPKNG